MTRRPRLLFLAFWFPPSRASGVYRALAITRAFVDAGWSVTVATVDERFLDDEIGSTDASLLAEIPGEAEIRRVGFTTRRPSAVTPIGDVGRLRANVPLLWNAIDHRLFRLRGRLASRLPGRDPLAGVEDKYLGWIDPVVADALAAHAEKPFDHVLATGNPYASFEAARRIASASGTGFSLDYRDPWTLDVFTAGESLSDATRDLEASLVDESTVCFHVNDALAAAYGRRYPLAADRQIVVANGFDRSSVPPPSEGIGPITFGLIGTLNAQWPLDAMFDGWRLARPQLPAGAVFRFGGHLGYFGRNHEALLAELPGADDGFDYVGSVRKDAVADFYGSCRAVVVPAPGGPFVTSGKVFEAAALGLPVVCIQQEGGGARQVLANHPAAFFAKPEPPSVAAAFRDAAEAAVSWTKADVERARAWAEPFAREHALARMVTTLESVVGQSA